MHLRNPARFGFVHLRLSEIHNARLEFSLVSRIMWTMQTTKSKPGFDPPEPIERTTVLQKNVPLEILDRPKKRFGAPRLTIGRLIGGVAILSSLLVFGESWYTLFVFEIVVIYVCSEILVDHLPWSLSSAMKRNCIRQDGSWSTRREKTERFAIEKLRWDIRVTLLLVLIPTTLLVCLVDQSIVPIRLGFTGLASLRVSEKESRTNLADEEGLFEDFARGNLADRSLGIDVETQKRVLWNFWPVALVGALFWIAVCWIAIQKSYVYQLKELSLGIKSRGLEYIQFDRAHEL